MHEINKTVRLSKRITYFILLAFSADLIGRLYFLFLQYEQVSLKPDHAFITISLGIIAVAVLFRSASYFEERTARRIIHYIAAIVFFRMASYSSNYLEESFLPVLLSSLSIICEVLALSASVRHLKTAINNNVKQEKRISQQRRYYFVGVVSALIIGVIAVSGPGFLPDRMNPFTSQVQWLWVIGGLSVSGMAVTFFQLHRPLQLGIAVGLGLPIAVTFRIVIDVFRDPNSHGVYPLTIFFSLVVGFLAAFSGVVLAITIRGLKLHFAPWRK